jgi:hypothetical protein
MGHFDNLKNHEIGNSQTRELHYQFDNDPSSKIKEFTSNDDIVAIEFKGPNASIVFTDGKGKTFKLFIKPKADEHKAKVG